MALWVNTAVPFAWSWSSAACSVTLWFVLQLELVNVSDAPVFTDRFASWLPLDLRATDTVTLAEGWVASFTL